MNNSLENILKNKKLKVTPARLTILECFCDEHKPMNAEEIAKRIKVKKIDLATIYRTLEVFEGNEIIKRVDLRQDSVFYELAHHHHHHMVCKSCGAIEDFETCDIEKMLTSIIAHSKKFSSIEDHSLELFGLCKKCINK